MIRQISISNFALIDSLRIEFHESLNVLTGETGAGKSILIDALRLCLGDRMDTAYVRDPQALLKIEVIFELSSLFIKKNPLLKEYMSEDDQYCIIKREYSAATTKTKATINNSLVNISTLREVGTTLVDLHGQYDHQYILDPTTHIAILDRIAGVEKELEAYQEIFKEYDVLKKKKDSLENLDENNHREIDLLQYQIQEITQANIGKGEEQELREEYKKMSNAQRLADLTHQLRMIVEDGDDTISEKIQSCFSCMEELKHLDESAGDMYEALEQMQIICTDLGLSLSSYQDSLSFDPQRWDEVDQRLECIDQIRRKYGNTYEEIQRFLKDASEKYDELTRSKEILQELEKQLSLVLPKLSHAANILREKREQSAKAVKNIIEQELHQLGMPHTVFETQIKEDDFSENGKESIEFFISPNIGEELKPLAKIISGGEAARLMLALKKALMGVDPIPTLIFDEIDANIGGRLGSVVGKKLKEVAQAHQVLLITHLPQIAAFADQHVKIYKHVQNNRAVTGLSTLEEEQRVQELANMLSGEEQSEISEEHARQLLKNASQVSS